MFKRPRTSPLGPDGKVRCPNHNIRAVLRTSHQPASQNRRFWTCPERPPRESPGERTGADCGFFYWENDIVYPDPPPSPMSPTTPSRIHSPTKRSAPYFMTPDAKSKRLRAIQDALPSSSMDVDAVPHPNPSEPTIPTTSSSLAARNARPAEEIRNSLPQSHDTPLNSSPSFTSSAATPHVHSRSSELNIDLSGPRIRVSTANRNRVHDHTSADKFWGSFVSPHTSSPDEVAADLLSSPDLSMDKGKQRAIEQDQEEDAFWNSPPSESTSHQNGLFSPSISSNQPQYQYPPEPRPQPNTQVPLRIQTSAPTTSDPTGDQIQTLIQGLSGVPEYVKKLERKLLAMQKSNESKARRIKELEAQIQELKSCSRTN